MEMANLSDFNQIMQGAVEWVEETYPEESPERRAACVNSVLYLVTGFSGGYGGPSMREHLVSWSLGQVSAISVGGIALTTVQQDPNLPRPGKWDFYPACRFAADICFADPWEISDKLLIISEREYCFDDDPEDLAVVRSGGKRSPDIED